MLGGETHVSYVLESRGSADHGFVDFASSSRFLFLGAGRANFGLCILGAVRDFFEKVTSFAFISKRESDKALVALERVKESAVLIVLEAFVELVLPDDTTGALEINYLEVERGFG